MKFNRHFFDREDIEKEFSRSAPNEIDLRTSYPLRFFSKLPKEELTKADFPELLKSVTIPKFVPVSKPIRKTTWERASWPHKSMIGKDAQIRDIHAQLCAEFCRRR